MDFSGRHKAGHEHRYHETLPTYPGLCFWRLVWGRDPIWWDPLAAVWCSSIRHMYGNRPKPLPNSVGIMLARVQTHSAVVFLGYCHSSVLVASLQELICCARICECSLRPGFVVKQRHALVYLDAAADMLTAGLTRPVKG